MSASGFCPAILPIVRRNNSVICKFFRQIASTCPKNTQGAYFSGPTKGNDRTGPTGENFFAAAGITQSKGTLYVEWWQAVRRRQTARPR